MGLGAAASIHPTSSVDGVVAMPQHPDTRTPSSYAAVWTSSGGPRYTRAVGRACRALAYGKRWLAGGAHAQGPHVACAPSKTNQMHWYWIFLVSLSMFDSAAAQATNAGPGAAGLEGLQKLNRGGLVVRKIKRRLSNTRSPETRETPRLCG